MYIMSTMGDRIRQSRERKGMTQIELSDRVGVDNTTIAGYEKNTRVPNAIVIMKIADELGVTVRYLVKGIESPKSHSGFYTRSFFFERDEIEYIGVPMVEKMRLDDDNNLVYDVVGHTFANTSCNFYPSQKKSTNLIWLKSDGDVNYSFRILSGSYVLVQITDQVEDGKIAAICTGDQCATFRKIYYRDGSITLASTNPQVPDETMPRDQIRVIGKVLGTATLYEQSAP